MSYKRGVPYVYASQTDEEEKDNNATVHFWGECDDSCKQMEYYKYYMNKGILIEGIKMTMKDLDEIVIKRIGEIVNEEYETDKYKKIEKMFNENKKFRFGKGEKKELIYDG
jgi:hypothetical protein